MQALDGFPQQVATKLSVMLTPGAPEWLTPATLSSI
jgi:hypothetical protein